VPHKITQCFEFLEHIYFIEIVGSSIQRLYLDYVLVNNLSIKKFLSIHKKPIFLTFEQNVNKYSLRTFSVGLVI
jgi:hypothetical protein